MTPEQIKEKPPTRDISNFRARIVRWFGKHGRNYPWRETDDPFRVLIAEMMLRRTKADQVLYMGLLKEADAGPYLERDAPSFIPCAGLHVPSGGCCFRKRKRWQAPGRGSRQ